MMFEDMDSLTTVIISAAVTSSVMVVEMAALMRSCLPAPTSWATTTLAPVVKPEATPTSTMEMVAVEPTAARALAPT